MLLELVGDLGCGITNRALRIAGRLLGLAFKLLRLAFGLEFLGAGDAADAVLDVADGFIGAWRGVAASSPRVIRLEREAS